MTEQEKLEIINKAHEHTMIIVRDLAFWRTKNAQFNKGRDHFDRKSFIKGVEWTLSILTTGEKK